MFRLARLALFALIACSLTFVSSVPVAAQEATPAEECLQTTPEENEELVRRYWQEAVWGEQGTLDEIVAEDEVHHWGIGDDTHGFAALSERWGWFNDAFPNLEFTVDVIAAEGDMAASLWTATGTQNGEFQGIAPTGRDVTWNGINIFRIECGKIAESWGEANHIGLLAQLGASDVPAMAAESATAATATADAAATACADDAAEANLATAQRWTEEVWTGQDLAVLDEIAAPDIVHRGAAFPDAHGVEELKQGLQRQFDTFPDMHITLDDVFADGDLVVARWSGTGTQDGDFLGVAPTGAEANLTGINIYRMSCGKIVESWSEMKALAVLRALQTAAGTPTP
jgi:predicted ester cyclase